MWWEFVENNKPKKSLVSIKSDNLVWDYNININIKMEGIKIDVF